MAIDIAYEPTFRDFLAMNRWITRRRWRIVRYLSAVMLALYLTSPFLFHDIAAEGVLLPYAQSLAVLVLPAVVLVVLPANLYLAAKKRWNAAPEIREPRRFAFSEDGIAVEGSTFSGRIAWSHVTGAEFHRVREQVEQHLLDPPLVVHRRADRRGRGAARRPEGPFRRTTGAKDLRGLPSGNAV